MAQIFQNFRPEKSRCVQWPPCYPARHLGRILSGGAAPLSAKYEMHGNVHVIQLGYNNKFLKRPGSVNHWLSIMQALSDGSDQRKYQWSFVCTVLRQCKLECNTFVNLTQQA
eukprot:1048398-Rhodomonas_salina.1